MNILLCTLGASWAVIPEVYGFIDPARLDLYRYHPARESLDRLRREHAIPGPDELWLTTTEGRQTRESLASLRQWWNLLGEPVPMRVWCATGTDQLSNQAECDHIRELMLRVVLRATQQVRAEPAGRLILSLAGGRKTMSADLQWAGSLFGAHCWLHIVGPDPLPAAISRDARPERFISPLPPELAGAVTPLVVGEGRRDELLDVAMEGRTVSSAYYPVPHADPSTSWPMPAGGASLTREIRNRQRQGSQLFGNFLADLAADERHENWRSLYRLPPADIEALRVARLGDHPHEDREWLRRLPKADLHRHIGGCLDLDAQRAVGRAIWASLRGAEQSTALDAVAPLLRGSGNWPWDWPRQLRARPMPPRSHAVAALLVEADEGCLRRNLWENTEPRTALKQTRGFAAYERPGELTGSSVLSHPAALEPYVEALVAQAVAEGLAYVELRGSPQKYRMEAPAKFVEELGAALRRTIERLADTPGSAPKPEFRFVWILDRRQRDTMAINVRQAIDALEHSAGFLVGLDLAGDEGTNRPEQLAPWFEPAFRACLPITIHAGEGEPAANIWEAAYRLHADRIGHGLTLLDDPPLLARFRDRGICLELCPTSNREVVGYHDPGIPETSGLPAYPVRELLRSGLPVTLATDNPGISRTTLADEFLAASRMAETPLSRWEALALIKQGFTRAFVSADRREQILKRTDTRIYRQLA